MEAYITSLAGKQLAFGVSPLRPTVDSSDEPLTTGLKGRREQVHIGGERRRKKRKAFQQPQPPHNPPVSPHPLLLQHPSPSTFSLTPSGHIPTHSPGPCLASPRWWQSPPWAAGDSPPTLKHFIQSGLQYFPLYQLSSTLRSLSLSPAHTVCLSVTARRSHTKQISFLPPTLPAPGLSSVCAHECVCKFQDRHLQHTAGQK